MRERIEHRVGGLEKDELTGNVSYDPQNHEKMIKLRAEKIERIADDIPPTKVEGDPNGDLLIIGWGSTRGAIQGALRRAIEKKQKVSWVHLRYINPFPKDLGEIIKKYDKVLVPEMNSGQLALMLRAKFLVDVITYSKIQGRPFTTSEIGKKISDLLEG